MADLTLDFNCESHSLLVDFFVQVCSKDYSSCSFEHIPSVKYMNETLAHYGLIGTSPEKPTLAFSFQLFDIYQQLHCVCPQFSLDALSKAPCHLHHVSLIQDSYELSCSLIGILHTRSPRNRIYPNSSAVPPTVSWR